jgi:periplasmic protein TonB
MVRRVRVVFAANFFSMKVKTVLLKTLLAALFVGSIAIARASDEGVVIDADVRPVPVKTPPPIYPTMLKSDGVEGIVAVKAIISEDGSVLECSVSKSSRAEFEGPAVDAVKKWKFKPASKGGVAVKTRVVIPIKFSVET